MCALSNFHVTTARDCDKPKGTRLDFETSGKLKSRSVVASGKGTTVAVEQLFKNLPVRRKELERNIKREFQKVLNLLSAYACISTGVRFNVTNLVAKG
jgi:DNA mismatch repair protein PMS2